MSMFERLAAPFPPDRVSWRVGSTNGDKTKGMALAYIDARDVMQRLDEVCTPAGWERRHPHVGGTTTCEIAIWIEGRGWVVKSDGAGDTAVEAEKGSLSDSFKRSAVNWGIGRYLYDLKSPWVELETRGRSQIIKPTELPKLTALLRQHAPQFAQSPEPPPQDPRLGDRKTSAQAKRDGDHDKIKADIAGLDTKGVQDWYENFDSYTAHLPLSWLDPIRDQLEARREDLMRPVESVRQEREMDAAYAETFRGEGAGGLAGRPGPLELAQ